LQLYREHPCRHPSLLERYNGKQAMVMPFRSYRPVTKAILLAAGDGTRLLPLTNVLPKCLMPINGRPLLEWWLTALAAAGINTYLINLHYQSELVKRWAEQSPFADSITFAQEKKLLGTAGTLLHNQAFVGNEPVMLIHADNLCLCNLKKFIHAHVTRPSCTDITMMTFVSSRPETCGIVEVDGRGVVQGFYEKTLDPHGNLANAAVYIVEPTIMDFLLGLSASSIDFSTHVLPYYVGKIYTYHNAVYHRDIGTSDSFMAAQIEFPENALLPEGFDSWKNCCEGDGVAISERLLASLSLALDATVIDVYSGAWVVREQDDSCKGKILNIRYPEVDLEQVAISAKEKFPHSEDIYLYFSKVPPGFSSKDMYSRYGLNSLAVCACM
jgi:mannose-1-phosphate guanylyltransferase